MEAFEIQPRNEAEESGIRIIENPVPKIDSKATYGLEATVVDVGKKRQSVKMIKKSVS